MIHSAWRAFLAWSFRPPKWARDTQAVFDAYNAEQAARIARMDAELAAFKHNTPRHEQGRNAFDKEPNKEE